MFESAELEHKLSKARYKREAPQIREALLDAQYALKERAASPVIILINGVDGAGKGETVNLLNAWMDPRLIQTHSFGEPTDEEREQPPMWRFWRALPPRGRVGILFGSWYTDPILKRVGGQIKGPELDHSITNIRHFERMLVCEGALLLKFWFHLSKDQQRTRLKQLEKDPTTRWRVTDTDWDHFKLYDKFRRVSQHTLRETSVGDAPWVVIAGQDPEYRSLTVATALLQALRTRLDQQTNPAVSKVDAAPLLAPIDGLRVLDGLDQSLSLEKKAYELQLEEWQGKLNLLTRQPKFKKKRSVVVVFEGNDAAGKGGSIRRITAALDARQYRVIPIAAPTDEERAQPYLWRFWRHLPRRGHFSLFDRSWYGRVLVERVEGLCTDADWMRAYNEINEFEEQLVESGVVVVKFWLAITKDEQLARFKERERVSFKQFKITDEDWRNREKWDGYAQAVHDMVERTSTGHAPWTLIEANDKNYARVKILKTLAEALAAEL